MNAKKKAEVSAEHTEQLIQDLRVHQIELEMQNQELQRTQAELEASRARYFALFDMAPVGYLSTNEPGLIVEGNLAFSHMVGVVRKDLIRRLLSNFIVPADQEMYYRMQKRLFATSEPQVSELRLKQTNGGEFWVRMEVNLAQDTSGANLCQAVLSDITIFKQSEAALRESESRFRNLIKTLPLPIAILKKSGDQTYLNDRFIQVFGYSLADIPVREAWRKLAFPDEKYRQWAIKTWNTAIEQAAGAGQDLEPKEYNITCKDGTVRAVMASGIILGDEVLATFTDITEERRHEQLMKAAYERRKKNDLMNELLQDKRPSDQTVYNSDRILGDKSTAPFSCFLIVVDEYNGKSATFWRNHFEEYHFLLDSIMDALEADSRISWDSQDGIGVLCFEADAASISRDKQQAMAEQLRNDIYAKVSGVKISIGIAESAANMTSLATRHRQAHTAITVGKKVRPHLQTFHYLDMGVFQLLSFVTDEGEINAYIERTLGKLLQYDTRKREAFLNTLEVILMSDNLRDSAEKLSIHYQTLMFRKQRLETILGISFDDFSSRLAMSTALQMLKLRKHG